MLSISFLALAALGIALPLACLSSAMRARRIGVTAAVTALLLAASAAVLLLRPHQHVFQGLDCSAYRLMAKAFEGGRGLHGHDNTLASLPEALRRDVLLDTVLDGRLTRDRSFEVRALEDARTQPYFYPTLPLCMAAFGRWFDLDGFMPLLGLCLALALIATGTVRGGAPGATLAMALLVGSPLPVWMLRGAFAEAAGAVFAALAALAWLQGATSTFGPGFALGLALSFHPSLLPLAAGIGGLMLLDPDTCAKPKHLGRFFLGGLLGIAPLLFNTIFIAQPYGALNPAAQWLLLRTQPAVAALYAAAAIAAIAVAALWKHRLPLLSRLTAMRYRHPALFGGGVCALVSIPWLVTRHVPAYGAVVRQGELELGAALQWPFGILMVTLIAMALFGRRNQRASALTGLVLSVLPMYLALKGYEQAGFWSQRRLVPPLLVLIPALLIAGCDVLNRLAVRVKRRKPVLLAAVFFVIAAALHNPLRWPAPYLMREEAGVDARLAELRAAVERHWTVCDYYPHSVPLAVFNAGERVIGLNRLGRQHLDTWMALTRIRLADGEPVQWLSAYANPGIEADIAFEPLQAWAFELPVLAARHALPAKKDRQSIAMTLLRAHPADPRSPPVLDKHFDGGPLALRGPWLRQTVRVRQTGERFAWGMWARSNSAVIGPLPPPGGSARLTLDAASGRPGDEEVLLFVTPPWESEPATLTLGPLRDTYSILLKRPIDDAPLSGATALYRFNFDNLYDPAVDGLTGYPTDLGATFVALRIAVVDEE